jgi:hypothetical protein
MDSIIETKIIDILTEATITNVDTDIVVNIEDELKDWEEASDYPTIVVSCNGWIPIAWQAGMLQKEYTIFAVLIISQPSVKEAKSQRATIHDRIDSALRSNQQLTGLADISGKEHAYQMNVVDVKFAHAGFANYVQAIARFTVSVQTNRIGPF